MPRATILLWTYTCSTYWGSNPNGSFCVHDLVMLVLQHYICFVFIFYHMQIYRSHTFSQFNTIHASCSINIMFFLSTIHEISTLPMAQQHATIHVSISIHNHLSQHIEQFYNISHHSSLYWNQIQTHIFIHKYHWLDNLSYNILIIKYFGFSVNKILTLAVRILDFTMVS
jgi:hypothetical protein